MYQLTDEIAFPNPAIASDEGLLAVGGDLSPQRILFAYQNGIFPWYNEYEPILWWSPNPRFVLKPNQIVISKSMRKLLKKEVFQLTFDTAFSEVLHHCATVTRKGQDGTWLITEMIAAYQKLHELGFAHSVEVWQDKKLVGGLYGLSLWKVFFGESMFANVSNASKAALIHLAQTLDEKGFDLIDCQTETAHLYSMGARFIPRIEFLEGLSANQKNKTWRGSWKSF